jgi:hypothetical protein
MAAITHYHGCPRFWHAPPNNLACICSDISRKLDGVIYDTFIDPIYNKYHSFHPDVAYEREPEPNAVDQLPVIMKAMIDPEEVIRVCAQEAKEDFHQSAVEQLLQKFNGSEPDFGNRAAELAEELRRVQKEKDTLTFWSCAG